MKQAILLVNLGTPEEPEPAALRRYLLEFLSDPRVVDYPRWWWQPLLRWVILPRRVGPLAQRYARIWSADGSPLKVFTVRQAKLLRGLLGEQGQGQISVDYAMRYGQPSIGAVLARLASQGVQQLCLLPLYPQYAGSTTGSIEDALAAWQAKAGAAAARMQVQLVPPYPDAPAYINALTNSVRALWQAEGRCKKLLMSFHGLPQRMIAQGDPYAAHCRRTAEALAAALKLHEEEWLISYQSRFGPQRWLEPDTVGTLTRLARAGVQRVDVVCPGFVSDCIETLHEIDIEAREDFLAAGGEELRYIRCLNDRPDWIAALAQLARPHLTA